MLILLPKENALVCKEERFSLYLDRQTIQDRVAVLGRQLSLDYEGKTPVFVGVLNGSFMFFADLLRAVEVACEVDFIKLSSYGAEKISSGQVHSLKKMDANAGARHLVVVEDIIDTGLSMQFILNQMATLHPSSVRVVTLLHKPEATRVTLQPDYVGFQIPNRFVLGYGLDYGQVGRNLPDLYIRDEDVSPA